MKIHRCGTSDVTYIELYGIVERLTYKPGSTFVLSPHVDLAPGDGARLTIRQRLPNVKSPIYHTEIALIKTITSIKLKRMDVMEFMSWLHKMLEAMETHEINEWLKLDGKTLFDPHPEKKLYPVSGFRRILDRWRATA